MTARAAWAAATAVTLDEGTRAATELTRRGLTPGTEPDRTTTPDWLDAHHHNPDAATTRDTAEDTAERAAKRARAIAAAHHTADTHNEDQDQDQDQDQDAVEDTAEHDDQLAEVYDPAATPDPRSPELLVEPAEHGWGHSRGSAAAYDVVPVTATLDDLHATAAIAAVALDRAAQHTHQNQSPTDTADLDDNRSAGASTGVDRHDIDGTD